MTEGLRHRAPPKLGKFEIIKELGRGSTAVVYLGYDPFMERNVAMKVALPKLARDDGSSEVFRKMFFNEAHVAGMLDHKFILPVYDAGAEGDFMYLVMEYVKGSKTLAHYTGRDNLLPVPKTLEVIYKCCTALDYAHSRGVIHRDIKPSNILLTEENDVRVADFGIAQVMRAEETQIMGVMGSPLYMSPEQVGEQPLTNQTDLYSLGVVMYQLLTGRPPFVANTLPSLINMIVNEEPPLMRVFMPDTPEPLEMVLKKALAKNTGARYQRGGDFAADLVAAFKQQKHIAVATDSSRQEKFKRLRANRFFRSFMDSEIWEIIDACMWSELPAGKTVITEGELDESFYIIVKGKAVVKKAEVVLSTLGEGDCFGEMAYFTKTTRTASVETVEDIMLVKASSALLERASLACQLRFMKVFVNTLIERLSITSAKLANNA